MAAKKSTSVKHTQQLNSQDDEIKRLRAQNDALKSALNEISSCAEEHMKAKLELVWFAMNRTRYPTHPTSKFMESSESHRAELQKLKSNECDFHHGFNFGVLASSRLFKNISDIVQNVEEQNEEENQKERVEEVKQSFPDLSVNSSPPEINA